MSAKARLFLIPAALDTEYSGNQVGENVKTQISHLRHFAVEDLRHSRRYLRKLLPNVVIDECTFYEIGKHAPIVDQEKAIHTLRSGTDVGVISEAGLPAVADPGHGIVAAAHKNKILVRPLIGPGSVFLALVASGFNGQEFTFHGYLPKDNHQRSDRIKSLEQQLYRTGYTQIFMETPFRNMQLLDDVLKNCGSTTGLCIAASITTSDEFIRTMPIKDWKKEKVNLHKKPAIFLLGKI